MQRVFSRASCRELGGLAACSPGLCGWKNGLTCRKQPVLHRQWSGVCVRPARPARPFTGEQGRKLCRARLVLAGQKHRLFGSQPGDSDPPRSSKDEPRIAVVGITNPITWLRCKLLIFLINLHFDLDIGSVEFGRGVKQALVHISKLMSSGQYHRMVGIVSTEMIEHIEKQCSSLSDAQRQQLAVTMDDILVTLPEDVSVAFDQRGRKFCSIVLRFWFLSTSEGPDDPKARILKVAPREDGAPQRKVATAVFEFHGELLKGTSPDWTVTTVWHWHWNQAE
ncbi:m-AAA protease-interacting protein 1, mitochondrial isoform X1 [Larimichthys crocea]|uniref:m-AAA protease-interacting protein 1, mitochondrial isoform X1 n=1 Tax=Larimichthys crocea TaxID=215358 RepID=UPI000F5D6EDB|nr:m-AAA protease-interacting protein 1, mitochondrial isoform X1 [Larimichthys crocea]